MNTSYYHSHIGSKHDTLNGIIYFLKGYKERYNNSLNEQRELKEKIILLRTELETKLETPNKDMESIISLKHHYDNLLNKYNSNECKLTDNTNTLFLDLCKLFLD